MKIEHAYHGRTCTRLGCDAPQRAHRAPRARYVGPHARVDRRKRADRDNFLGVDGEGQTVCAGCGGRLDDGARCPKCGDTCSQCRGQLDDTAHCTKCGRNARRHDYVMLCAASETGQTWVAENRSGLSTVECLEFLLSLPNRHTKTFAYSFGYDLTKILSDVDEKQLYELFRPELRRRTIETPKGPRQVNVPVHWRAYSLNYLSGRFTVMKAVGLKPNGKLQFAKGSGHTVHDIWRFFQGKFTGALEDWKAPGAVSPEERERLLTRMREMKDKRSQFDKMPRAEVLAYCLDECRYMAELARKLTDAHQEAGIPLKNYFGAGSSASAMLEAMGIKKHIKAAREENETPAEIEEAIACAFFGGRFENSVIGSVPGPVYSYDISSAYPYQLCFLPCLVHGRWARTNDPRFVRSARTALVRYSLERPKKRAAWAPFPFRLADGSITFPEESGGGWLWRDEYLAGARLFPNVRFHEAWVYDCDCDCRPFVESARAIAGFYVIRLRIGKEGAGIVIKLAMNSCYGKTAQFIGGDLGAFTSWMWAGLITSGCRAQILDLLGLHRDWSNLLMVATDGIATRERLPLPQPRDTGTFGDLETPEGPTVKPLGGWEEKTLKKGLFLARPGIYFPLDPTTDDVKKVRARGLGRSVVYEHWRAIVEAYERGAEGVHVKNLSRFIGAKTGVTRSGVPGAYVYKRSRDFGQWITRPVDMGFDPLPKREGVGEGGRLGLRSFPELVSAPYRKGVVSPEARQLRAQADEDAEQPDGGDYADYDVE